MTAAAQFFVTTRPSTPMLLRRSIGAGDEAFLAGAWQPTKMIVDFLFGNDDFVEPITLEQAQKLVPAAFAPALVN